MANVAVAGFQPIRRSGGGNITYRRARVLSNNTLAIALFDAVVIDANGDTLQASTTTTAVSSVSNGASYVDATGVRVSAKSLPAATVYSSSGNTPDNANYVFVVDNSLEVDYMASVSNSAIAMTDMNLNYPFIVGTITNGISGMTLNATGRNTTATIPFRVQDFIYSGDSDPDLIDCHVACKINAGMWEPALESSGSLGS